jgi:hypothetical protein
VDPVPDPLLLIKSGSAGNRTRGLWISSQKFDIAQRVSVSSSVSERQNHLQEYQSSESEMLIFP